MNKEIKRKIIITVMVLFLLIIPFSLALFIATSNTEAKLTLDFETVDNKTLIFDKGDPISLYVELDKFDAGAPDAVAITNPSVRLTSLTADTDNYSVYLYIYDNSVNYSTESMESELILNIYDENSNEIKSLENLVYISDENVSGFDITNINGLLPIVVDNEISTNSNSSVVHDWTFKVTFRNLEEVQNLNLGQRFNAQICLAQSLEECDFVGFSDVILSQNGGSLYIESKDEPDFAKAAMTEEAYDTYDEWCADTTYCSIDRATPNENGMYATEDADGTTYYYRGSVDNNWVVFGKEGGKDIYWRIVRVEGNGNVKMIYSGTTPPTEEDAVTMESTSTQLADTSVFNTSNSSTVYSGYVYQTGVLHGTSTNSTIKGKVDAWYNTNLANDYSEYIEPSEYCIDRVTYTISGSAFLEYVFTKNTSQVVTSSIHYYPYWKRLAEGAESNPSLYCEVEDDILNSYVGMMSADELAMAGGRIISNNNSFYLYTSNFYWLISPGGLGAYGPAVSSLNTDGAMVASYILSTHIYGIRPTISLSSSLFVSKGNGTWNDPYIIT